MFIEAQKARNILKNQKFEIINPPQIDIEHNSNNKLITVIIPTYNAEKFIEKTIQSVIDQSIGFKNIQIILIDDYSSDNTKEIIQKYTKKYNNICSVFLKKNTGTPGTPRNIGIELANSKYVTFLDADDWLHPNGLETLYNIIEKRDDDLVVGRTIRVETDKIRYIGEFYTHTERKSISPFDEPLIFQHCAPPARMMKLSVIKQNDIRFPEMQFAEDKTFFIDVLLHAKKISITTQPIYYVNRTKENDNSITTKTNIFQKRLSDLKLIKYIKNKKLPNEIEKMILNRFYEYDLLKRTLDTKSFVNGNWKVKIPYYFIIKKFLKTTKDLRYDYKEEIKNPIYRTAIDLYLNGRKNDFIRLFKWSKLENDKKIIIKNQLPYYKIPFLDEENKYIKTSMFAKTTECYIKDDIYYHTIEVYGDYIDEINCIVIRNRKNVMNEVKLPYTCSGNILSFQVDVKNLEALGNGRFAIFIQYNNYKYINIKNTSKNKINYNGKVFEFYTTIYNNLALTIK